MEQNTAILELLESEDEANILLAFRLCVGRKGNYSPMVADALQEHILLCVAHEIEGTFYTQLKALNLNGLGVNELPPQITQLKQLKNLWAWKNNLTSVPAEIGNLTQLRVLSLQYNQLTSLPPEIAQLTQLRDLYLYGNKIPKIEREKISKWLPNCDIRFKRFED